MTRTFMLLPWPPSVNQFKTPVPRKRGKYFLSDRAKQFRAAVCLLALDRKVAKFGSATVILDIFLRPPINVGRYDADNFLKAIFDALQHAGVYDDDAQVASFRVSKDSPTKHGEVEVHIWERGSVQV